MLTISCIYRHVEVLAIELRAEESKIEVWAMEQTWLDEDTALKAAALKGVGGSSPSCSATFQYFDLFALLFLNYRAGFS